MCSLSVLAFSEQLLGLLHDERVDVVDHILRVTNLEQTHHGLIHRQLPERIQRVVIQRAHIQLVLAVQEQKRFLDVLVPREAPRREHLVQRSVQHIPLIYSPTIFVVLGTRPNIWDMRVNTNTV
jgi:hypothetical protein